MSKKYAFDQYFAVRGYWPVCDFSPDGKETAYITNTSGQFNIWKQALQKGCPEQLTFFEEETVDALTWLDQQTIFFSAQLQGNENHQFYLLSLKDRWPVRITHDTDAQHFFSPDAFSPDRSKLAFHANIDRKENFDIYMYDFRRKRIIPFLKQDKYLAVASWSPDGKNLLVLDAVSMYDSTLYTVNVRSKKMTLATPHDGKVQYLPGPWDKDGKGFYLLTNQDREYMSLAYYSLKDREFQMVRELSWDIEFLEMSPDRQHLFYAVNEDGWSKLYRMDTKTRMDKPVPLPRGVLMESPFISRNSRQMILFFRKSTHPTALYHCTLPRFQTKQISEGFLAGIKEKDLVTPRNVTYKSFDGRTIPALLSKPVNIRGKIPVVLSIHGGPHHQERPYYIAFDQFLLSRGVAVLAPNFRGSTGYGQTYSKLINRDWGGGELKDFENAVRYLHTLPWVDKQRIAVWGGSFGGFATLSCLTRLAKYFCCGVDWFGPSNLLTFVQTIPPSWKRFTHEEVGDPDKDKDFLVERSPITYIKNITAPLLIIQGANDPRVVQAESDQMVEALRNKGLQVEYYIYKDEGHGFFKKRNMIEACRNSAMFLLKNLGINPV